MKGLYFPMIYLNNNVVKGVSKDKYLGDFLADDNSDDKDIFRQTRRIYTRSSTLIKNFKCCTEEKHVPCVQTLLYWVLLQLIRD